MRGRPESWRTHPATSGLRDGRDLWPAEFRRPVEHIASARAVDDSGIRVPPVNIRLPDLRQFSVDRLEIIERRPPPECVGRTGPEQVVPCRFEIERQAVTLRQIARIDIGPEKRWPLTKCIWHLTFEFVTSQMRNEFGKTTRGRPDADDLHAGAATETRRGHLVCLLAQTIRIDGK